MFFVVFFLFLTHGCTDVLGPNNRDAAPTEVVERADANEPTPSPEEAHHSEEIALPEEKISQDAPLPEKITPEIPAEAETPPPPSKEVFSPNQTLRFALDLSNGKFAYSIQKDAQALIADASLGLLLDGESGLIGNFELERVTQTAVDTSWNPVWGQHATIQDKHNESIFFLRETTGEKRALKLVVRVFNDAVAFRYQIEGKAPGQTIRISDELTSFKIVKQGTAWSIPLSFDTNEKLYTKGSLTDVQDANTPITFRLDDGKHMAIHEADLENYAGFSLKKENGALKVTLPPADKASPTVKVVGQTPFETPWRVILVTNSAAGLVESTTILNLNDPCVICTTNTNWITPRKYVGIWWEIHKGISLWKDGPNAAATTNNAKRYIDFASRAGLPGFLAEGWNIGWDGGSMDFLKANSQFDLQEVVRYGKSKQPPVNFIAHMETNADVAGLERQLDSALDLYQSLGIDTIKTGYVGDIPKYHHASQGMVTHYQEVLKKAATRKIMVNVHEPIKPTGMRRKYPNLISGEGARGMEYNAWSAGNPPSHTLTLPFTRILGGPLDYTPGIFYIKWSPQRLPDSPFSGSPMGVVHTTRARQLALYVLLFSGVQMVTDLPEHYNAGPGQGFAPEFAFIREVPVTWDETKVLTAQIGEYAVIARRSGNRWFLGAGTDTTPRTLSVPLSFLGSGTFVAKIFADGAGADVNNNPEPVSVTERDVTAAETLGITMAGSGGQAIIFTPK